MNATLNMDSIRLFILFVLPGLISIKVYSVLMPTSTLDWKTAILEGLFYSSINFAFFLPLIVFIHVNNFIGTHPILYALIGMVIVLVGPIVLPLIYRNIIKNKKLMAGLQLPYPTSWDYFFDLRIPVFVLIHLKDGNLVGGYFGGNSYATAFPNSGDIYIESVYHTNNDGTFGEKIQSSLGLLIRKEEYTYIELFDVPKNEEEGNHG